VKSGGKTERGALQERGNWRRFFVSWIALTERWKRGECWRTMRYRLHPFLLQPLNDVIIQFRCFRKTSTYPTLKTSYFLPDLIFCPPSTLCSTNALACSKAHCLALAVSFWRGRGGSYPFAISTKAKTKETDSLPCSDFVMLDMVVRN